MEEKLNYSYKTQEEESVFRGILNKFLPYWPLLLGLIVISVACGWVYLKYATPFYRSSATILIKDDKQGASETSVMETLDMFGGKKNVENEIEVIRSRTLAREVVKDLHLYAPVFVSEKFADKVTYNSAPMGIEVRNLDSFTVASKIPFVATAANVKVDGVDYAYNQWVSTPWGVLRFIPNEKNIKQESDRSFFFALNPVKSVANQLLGRLTVIASSKQSTIINIAYEDDNKKRAEDILNSLIRVYNSAAIRDKNTLAANTLDFVEKRLNYVVAELDSVEGKIQDYRTKNKVVDISAQGQLYLQTVGTNDIKISDLDMQMAVLNEVQRYVAGQSGKGSIIPSTLGISDPVLATQTQRLYELEMQYERLKGTTGENNPAVLSIVDQINKVKPTILENVNNQRRALAAGKQDLAGTNSRYTSMLGSIPQKERELLEISRQQSIKNNIYTFLLQKREETALSYASTVPDSRLIDVAETADTPVNPKPKMVYLMAILGALAAGILGISIREAINNNIVSRTEIEKYTTAPILGEIVNDNSKRPIVIAEGVRSYIAEQFRQLRTSLGYLGINNRKKRVLVTSTISGEGKSFVSSNLGVSLALMGKKVVMLELDLRKPKLSDQFEMRRDIGITNYLIGAKAIDQIQFKVPNIPNLTLIPSGPIPPNPSELIMGEKMIELLNELDKEFDYVIIDTAPVSPVTDAYILSPLCDATLYVVRYGVTPKSYIQKMDEQNRIRELKNRAIIFNGVKDRGFTKNTYGYGYAYVTEAEEKGKGSLFTRKKKENV